MCFLQSPSPGTGLVDHHFSYQAHVSKMLTRSRDARDSPTVDRCSRGRLWQCALLCFRASALVLSLPDRVVWLDFDSTPCITPCPMCLKPSGWDLCVGSVGAHCSGSRGLGRYSTRSLSTLSLTPGAIPPRGVVVEGGCASPPPFFLSSLSLLVLYITFFFPFTLSLSLSTQLPCGLV